MWISILVTAFLASIVVIAFVYWASPRSVSSISIILVGPPASGKTSFAHFLTFGVLAKTQTSQVKNTYFYERKDGRKIELLDFPGHPKLWNQIAQFNAKPLGMIFMLDSATLSKESETVGSSLLKALSYARKKGIKEILIAGNKSDFFTALSEKQIIHTIDEAMNERRRSKSGVEWGGDVHSDSNQVDEDEWLVEEGEYSLGKDQISVKCGSVTTNKTGAWKEWIDNIGRN